MSKMDSDYSELSKQAAPHIEQNDKLVAEALQLHSSPDIGVVENRLAKDIKQDPTTAALTQLGLEKLAESTQNPQVKASAYRDLTVLDQAAALTTLGSSDKEMAKIFLNETGAGKWLKNLEQTDPTNPDLKNLQTIQKHIGEAIDSPDSQNPARRYNPTFDTTLLYSNEKQQGGSTDSGKGGLADIGKAGPTDLGTVGQMDNDKVGIVMGHMISAEWLEAKKGNVRAAAYLQRFADSAPLYKENSDLLNKTLDHTDPEIATRLRRAMLRHEVIKFE